MENLFKTDFSDLEQLGKIFFAGKALDGSAVCWWIGSKHEPPKDNAAKEREVRYIVYILERARREG